VLDGHRQWVRAQCVAGSFPIFGPRQPREGGFILLRDMSPEAVDAILLQAPYRQVGVVAYEIISFKRYRRGAGTGWLAGLGCGRQERRAQQDVGGGLQMEGHRP
jgi:uncharacterized protein YciI